MHQHIDCAPLLFDLLKHRLDLGGVLPIADYSLLGALSYNWALGSRFSLSPEVHAGIASLLLIPLPLLGLGLQANLTLVDADLLTWSLGGEAAADVLLLLPALSGDVYTSVAFKLGWLRLGVRATAGYGLILPVSAGVNASARAFASVTF